MCGVDNRKSKQWSRSEVSETNEIHGPKLGGSHLIYTGPQTSPQSPVGNHMRGTIDKLTASFGFPYSLLGIILEV